MLGWEVRTLMTSPVEHSVHTRKNLRVPSPIALTTTQYMCAVQKPLSQLVSIINHQYDVLNSKMKSL